MRQKTPAAEQGPGPVEPDLEAVGLGLEPEREPGPLVQGPLVLAGLALRRMSI